MTLPITCKVYPDSLLKGEQPPPSAGTSEPGTGKGFWSGPGDHGCFSVGQPTNDFRPGPSDAPDLDPFFMGIDQLWLGGMDLNGNRDKDAWQNFGFDLDNTCTASPTCDPEYRPASCKRPISGSVPDGNDCRDNNFGKLQNLVSTSADIGGRYGLSEGMFNCGLCFGKYNVLLRVTGYNGTSNDDQVRLDLYRSPGLEVNMPLSDCSERNLCWWVPNSPWMIDRDSLVSPSSGMLSDAKISDDQAFVRDGYLVAHFPSETLLWFPGQFDTVSSNTGKTITNTTFPLILTNGIVSARIHRADDGTFRLSDGVIGGRVTEKDVLKGFRWVGLCEGTDDLYPVAKNSVTSNLDITADPNSSPDTLCDSISVGILFSARQANVGKVVEGPKLEECKPVNAGGAGGVGGYSGASG